MADQDKRVVRFALPGFRTRTLEIAPEAEDPESKRIEIIQEEDHQLDSNLVALDIGTKERNRTFQERLDEVWDMTRGWEAKLKTEALESFESITLMRESYEKHMDEYQSSFLDEIHQTFDKIDKEYYVTEVNRCHDIEANMNNFFHFIVPQETDRQLVEIRRRAKKSHETFEIEVQKTKKSQLKFVQRASKHIQNTAQRFTDEDALMSSCFFNLEDEVIQHERRASRRYLRSFHSALEEHVIMSEKIETEREKRQQEDVEVLNTVVNTQRLLQDTVLLHFGSDDDDSLI